MTARNVLIVVSVLFAALVALLAILGSGAVGIVAGVGGVLIAGAWIVVGKGKLPKLPDHHP